MIEIDNIFKFEILIYYMVTLTLKSKVHKFAYFIMLSLLSKLSDLGTSWAFWVQTKGLPLSAGSPQSTTKILPKTSLPYTNKHNLSDFETYWKSTCNTVWPTGSSQ